MGIRAALLISWTAWASLGWADPPPAHPTPGPHWAPPPGAIAPRPVARPCQVAMRTIVEPVGPKRVRIKAVATNDGAAPLTLTARDACPSGPITFGGLPAGYDYYGICNAGACPGPPRPPVRWTLPPGRTVTLAAVVVDLRGGTCNRALPPGSYEVSFVPPTGAETCAPTGATLRQEGPPPAPPPPPRRAVQCKPMPACGLACPGAFAHDANGCTRCACEEDPMAPRF